MVNLEYDFVLCGPFMGMGVSRIYGQTQILPAWDFFGDTWVRYQVIPCKTPQDLKYSDISSLTALSGIKVRYMDFRPATR